MNQPKTGELCHCRPGVWRDNCPDCEGTGQRIDFAAIRRQTMKEGVTMRFTATKWSTSEEKEQICMKLQAFALAGCPRHKFTKQVYNRLNSMFGHIAHYNIEGFFAEWFTTPANRLRWLAYIERGGWIGFAGDPAWTWSDVEKYLAEWAKQNDSEIRKAMA